MISTTNMEFARILSFALLLFAGAAIMAGEPGPRMLDFKPRISGELFISTMQADGSPYLHDNWVKGDLILKDGSMIAQQDFRYNGYLDALIWRQPKTLQSVKADKDLVEQFILYPPGSDTMVFQNITISPWYESRPLNLYAEIRYLGDISLVVHQRIRRTGETLESRGARIISRPRIELDPVYYIIMPDNEAREIRRLNRRSLSRLFPDEGVAIRSALRRAGIRINNEADLLRAVAVIDQLLMEE